MSLEFVFFKQLQQETLEQQNQREHQQKHHKLITDFLDNNEVIELEKIFKKTFKKATIRGR